MNDKETGQNSPLDVIHEVHRSQLSSTQTFSTLYIMSTFDAVSRAKDILLICKQPGVKRVKTILGARALIKVNYQCTESQQNLRLTFSVWEAIDFLVSNQKFVDSRKQA